MTQADQPSDPAATTPLPHAYDSANLAHVAVAVRELQHPTQIGPYHILAAIGEGGMGAVYKAEQREPIHRTVALKIVKLGMDTRQVIARFESERQALAMMNHPNVAKVLDAGATESGRPYFVMEYVQGEPITRFADRHKLTTPQRLELFIQACEAVQHAHQKAIIHRDLKPSNILVALQDDKALVKVIDFGVAKAVSQRLTEKTLFTESGQFVGTPEYMSPEQAETNAQDVDTRSDVYSLGVVLYELLAGTMPFDPGTLRSAGYQEIQRIIREVDPPRPSTRLSSLGAGATEVARCRQMPLELLQKELKTELEWIPLKAMRKDRAQRYATATELAEDIRNYLQNRPLRAGPESARYRLRKFLRRNSGAVAATVAMAVLLLAGITATTWQAFRATRAERATRAALAVVERQKKQVEDASASVQAVNDFLTGDLLRSADPQVARGEDLTVKQAVDAAARTVGLKFKNQPMLEASVRATLAVTYDAVGRADLGLPHAQWALEERRKRLGLDDPETLDAMNIVVNMLQSLGKSEQAQPLCVEAIERSRRALGENHVTTIHALSNMGHLLHDQGKISEAEPFYRQALEASRRAFGNEHSETLAAMNNMAALLNWQRRGTDAEPLFREVLGAQRRTLGDDHPDTLIAMNNLAMALQYQGKLEEAETLARDALQGSRKILGNEHPQTLIRMRNLAAVYQDRGKLDQAEPLFREALQATIRIGRGEHPDAIVAMNGLAALLKQQGKFDEAIQMYRDVVARCRSILGEDHPYTILALNNLGHALALHEQYEEAEPILAEVYRRMPQAQVDAQTAAICMSRWGICLVHLGRYRDGEEPLLEVHRRLLQCGMQQSQTMHDVLLALAKVCDQTSRPDEAAKWRAQLPMAATTATTAATGAP